MVGNCRFCETFHQLHQRVTLVPQKRNPDEKMPVDTLESLNTRLLGLGNIAIAVSGGVDSMTLSFIAHRVLGSRARMYHAVSPAVPTDATSRVRAHG